MGLDMDKEHILVWRLTERDRKVNEVAESLAKQGTDTPFVGLEPACSISGRSIRGILRNWRSRKHLEH
jgi:hypothetical protein